MLLLQLRHQSVSGFLRLWFLPSRCPSYWRQVGTYWACLLVVLCPTWLWAAEGGSISGAIQQGGQGIAEHRIMLIRFGADHAVQRTPGQTNAEGRFVFENLETEEDFTYFVGIRYEGQLYRSEPVTLQQTPDKTDVVIEISTPTARALESAMPQSAPHIAKHLIVMVFRNQRLEAREVVEVTNSGTAPYAGVPLQPGAPPVSLHLPLPTGYDDLRVTQGLEMRHVQQLASGLYYAAPLAPGTHQLVYTYTLPVRDNVMMLLRPRTLATGLLDILVDDEHFVASSDLSFLGRTAFEPHVFAHFRATDLPANSRSWVQLARRTPTSLLLSFSAYGLILGVVLLGIAMPLYHVWRHDTSQALATPLRPEQLQALQATQEQLLQHLAQLDNQYEVGALVEAVYQPRRWAYKQQLYELTQQLQQSQNGPGHTPAAMPRRGM